MTGAGTVAFESNSTGAKTITTAGLPFYNVTFNQSQTSTRVYTISEATNIHETLVVGNGATLEPGWPGADFREQRRR